MMETRLSVVLVGVLIAAGCGDDDGGGSPGVDAGGMADGGGGGTDGGPGTDGGTPEDGGGGDTDGGTTPAIEPSFVFVRADEAGDIVSTARLWSAPLGEDGPDLDAAEQLSIDIVDGYDDYGEDHYRPVLSPDGLWVAWIEVSDHHLYVRPVDGSMEAREVTASWTSGFAWSPDSAKIAILGAGQLRMGFVDGRSDNNCGSVEGNASPISIDRIWQWSPDSAFVQLETSYESSGDWFRHHYVCAATDDGSVVDLTPTGGGPDFGFGAGDRAVYVADGTVYVDDATGGARTEVGPGMRPRSSRDGSRFVYLDGPWDGGTLRTAEWDGTGVRAVSPATGVYAEDYVFSPDASVVAFNDAGSLRVAAFDGSFDHVLSATVGVAFGDGRNPVFSPDGARIAFPSPAGTFSRLDLYLGVTDTEDSATALFTEGWASGARWSDDDTLFYWGTDASFSSSSIGVWESMVATALDMDPDLDTLVQRHRPEGYVIRKVSDFIVDHLTIVMESSGSGVGTPMGLVTLIVTEMGGEWVLVAEVVGEGLVDALLDHQGGWTY